MRRLLLLTLAVWALGVVPSWSQELTISLGDGVSLTDRALQLVLVVTALSILPGLVIMITCFPFLVTVLSILRTGLGLQSAPPNMLIVSLAMFLTFYIMEPVLLEAWETGISPLIEGTLPADRALLAALDPFRGFMEARVDPDTYASLADLRPTPDLEPGAPLPLATLVPSFLLSEISRAFQVGFLIFLPFLIIDLVVAAVLMSMGMMMVPPAIVSLPFKLAFFVVADGWVLIAGALVQSYR
jgi:flagellar biosynthesis protein FliP